MMTLFASFAMADSYVKVTATPSDWEGDYLFVYEAEKVAFNGGLATLDAASNTIAVEIADGAIAANETTNAAKFTIAAVEGGYSVKSASGQYIGVSTYGNGLKQADAVGSYVHNSMSIDAEGNAIIAIYNETWNTTGGSMILNYNADKNNKRFRYYKGGSQKKIQLYKFTASPTPEPDPEPATRTLYCKVAQSWWKADGAAVGVYAFGEAGAENAPFPGVRMTAVEGAEDTWKADIDTALYKKVIFARMNPVDEGNQNWGAKTADLTIPADKDLYTITSTTPVWGDPGVTGEWSNYSPSVAPDPQPVLADGFYLIGKIGGVAGWAITDLKAEQKFAPNLENPGEYMLNVTLAEGDELKVVNVLNNEIATWYPGDDNFIVTAAYAGEKTVYFRPDGQGGEGWHRGCIYIAPNPATGISNNAVEGKAVKMIMDGQFLIIRNGKTYNVQGQQLK